MYYWIGGIRFSQFDIYKWMDRLVKEKKMDEFSRLFTKLEISITQSAFQGICKHLEMLESAKIKEIKEGAEVAT